MSNISITVEGLDDLADTFEQFPQQAAEAARRAVNYAADRFARRTANGIKSELNLGSTQLYNASNPRGSRIKVRRATMDVLTATVSASSAPMLLSNFATNIPRGRGRGVKAVSPIVMVSPGSSQKLNNAFYVQAKNGTWLIAVRLKPGESLRNKKSGRTYPLRKGDPSTSVLYGPSLDQAFRVKADDNLSQIGTDVRSEFLRQMEVLSK